MCRRTRPRLAERVAENAPVAVKHIRAGEDVAPPTASGFSTTWEWSEFAYVCDYRTPDKEAKRIGIIEAFHGERSRRHQPGR